MSYAQLMVFRNGLAEPDERYGNSHGVCAMVWEVLLAKYYDTVYPGYFGSDHRVAGINGGWEALWKAQIPYRPWERVVLEFTYDNRLVRGKDVVLLANALDRFEDAHRQPRFVCHLAAIAKRLGEIGPCDAVGLHATSVNPNPWLVRLPPEYEDARPYDLALDTRHQFVEMAEPLAVEAPAEGAAR
jgi:hypothetical protein